MKFEDIPEQQVHLLASMFRRPASEHWVNYAERVYSIEPQLDRTVLRPDFLHRLVQPPQSYYTPLCSLHKILDARVVHKIFLLVAMEVGVRLNKLIVAGRDKIGHKIWDCSILNLRSLHGAWLQPEVFWDTFGKTLDVPKGGYSSGDYMTKWIGDEEKCEACMLSQIGGDFDTVLDLQMVVSSRIHTKSGRKHRQPRLIKVIEGWLHAWKPYVDNKEWQTKLEATHASAVTLKDARRKLAKARRSNATKAEEKIGCGRARNQTPLILPVNDRGGNNAQRKHGSYSQGRSLRQSPETTDVYPSTQAAEVDPSASDGEEDHELRQTIYDTENEIIDCYAALISTPFLPGMGSQEHQKRASTLSRHCSVISNHEVDRSWPMIGSPKAQERLARSQSIRQQRTSGHGESVYLQHHTTVPEPAISSHERSSRSLKNLARSQSVRDKRISDRSWVTASIPPSMATTTGGSVRPEQHRWSKRTVHNAKPAEEASTSRPKGTRLRDISISPIREEAETKSERFPVYDFTGRKDPVSPLSPNVASSTTLRTIRREPPLPDIRAMHGSSSRSSSKSRDRGRGQDQFQTQKQGSRLPKPPEIPFRGTRKSTQFSEHLNKDSSVRGTSREQDTVISDTTHWSALYESEADRAKRLEKRFRTLNMQGESKADRRNRGK